MAAMISPLYINNKAGSCITAGLIVWLICACTQKEPVNMVFVKGGAYLNTKSNLYGKNATITPFYIGKYEVTQKEWMAVMHYNPSQFKGDQLPVEMVNWYDCIEYCNKRSIKEGLQSYYNIDTNKKDPHNRTTIDDLKWTVTINAHANGYRLPTEAEWEYAASGGQNSKSYTFSGSNDVNDVAWYWRNSGDAFLTGPWLYAVIEKNHCKTHPVGSKQPNELGLFDLSGNVREWCEEWYQDHSIASGWVRVQRGGGWMGDAAFCTSSYRDNFEANGRGPDQGFRVCRSRR